MKKAAIFIAVMAGILIGGLGVFTVFTYQIVVAEEETLFLKRQRADLDNFYIDVRDWNARDWSRHPELAQTLIQQGHGDLVKRSLTEGILDSIFPRKKD